MRRIVHGGLYSIILMAAICMFSGGLRSQTLTTMTFNIRYDNPGDGNNGWENRKAAVTDLIVHYAPAIFGIQEGLSGQVQYLTSNLGPYSFIGVGREDGKQKGEYAAIFYDTTQYKLIRCSTFWLSEHPEIVSVGWDAALERICTCGLFQNIVSGKYIWVFNTHFDHMGAVARQMSAKLILNRIGELNPDHYPLLLMGDFNDTRESEPIQTLEEQLSESSLIAQKPLYGPRGTFNNFDPAGISTECIDFIFTSKMTVLSCTHIDDRRNDGMCISDHYPVVAELKF